VQGGQVYGAVLLGSVRPVGRGRHCAEPPGVVTGVVGTGHVDGIDVVFGVDGISVGIDGGIAGTVAGTTTVTAPHSGELLCLIGGFPNITRRRDQRFVRGSCRQVSPLKTANPVLSLV
jgi:hypothetical protein